MRQDIFWKGLLEWLFDDLLRFVFVDADRVFDLQAPMDFMDKELAQICADPGGDSLVRFVDKLVKVKLKRQPGKYALIHTEVQGPTKVKERPLFGERMFRYFNLVYAKHQHRYSIASITIFTGRDGHLLIKSYAYSFMTTRLPFEYSTIDISGYSDEELSNSKNPFAWALFVAKQALMRGRDKEQRLLEKKWFMFKKLYQHGLAKDEKMRAILNFMEHYLPFKDPKTYRTFKERIDNLIGKKTSMDIFEQIREMQREKAVKKGKREARKEFVRELLARTKFSNEKIASLTKVTVLQVARLRKKLQAE